MTPSLRRGRRIVALAGALLGMMALTIGAEAAPQYTTDVWNGTAVDAGEHRTVALVDLPDTPVPGECSGTLIHRRWVLTAAHCLEGVPAAPVTVGLDGTAVGRPFGEVFTSRVHAVHPEWDNRSGAFDIALIRLREPSALTPVVLATPADVTLAQPGVRTNVVGWGATDGRGRGAGTLREGFLNVADDVRCSRAHPNYRDTVMVCGEAFESDACQGDSGGPLFSLAGDRPVQIGVTSFGFACDRSEVGVYARVSAARAWIDQVIAARRLPKVVTDIGGQISTTRITRGETVRFRIALVQESSGAPMIKQKLELLRRRQGTTAWRVVHRATTSVHGRASFADTPLRNMQYAVRHRATARTTATRTTNILVRVR